MFSGGVLVFVYWLRGGNLVYFLVYGYKVVVGVCLCLWVFLGVG